MNKQDLAWQLKYSASEWIYIVTFNNLLKQLFTPFKVIVIKPVGSLIQGQIVWVEQVKVTSSNLTTVFVIDGSAYYFYYFDILID